MRRPQMFVLGQIVSVEKVSRGVLSGSWRLRAGDTWWPVQGITEGKLSESEVSRGSAVFNAPIDFELAFSCR